MGKTSRRTFQDPTFTQAMTLLAEGKGAPASDMRSRRRKLKRRASWQTADGPGMTPGQVSHKSKKKGKKEARS